MTARGLLNLALAATVATAVGGCAQLRKTFAGQQEICSVIVSKEEGYKRVCQLDEHYRVERATRDELIDEATVNGHLHIARALAPGKVLGVYSRVPAPARVLDLPAPGVPVAEAGVTPPSQ